MPGVKSPLDYALAYHRLGWTVLPAPYKSKKPSRSWKEYQSSSPTVEDMHAWFRGRTEINLFLVTGVQSGVVVVDCDSKKADEWVGSIIKDLRPPMVTTRKGTHYYFAMPPERKVKGWSLHENGVDLDVRAEGNGVILPPSVHESGHKYQWFRKPRKPLPELPGPLWSRNTGKLVPVQGKSKERPQTLKELLASPPNPGDRNVWLTRVLGFYARDYRDDWEQYVVKVKESYQLVEAFEDPDEMMKTARSVWDLEHRGGPSASERTGWLTAAEGCLWTVYKGELVKWSNFNPSVAGVAIEADGRVTYFLKLQRAAMKDEVETVITSDELTSRGRLDTWLVYNRVQLLMPGADSHRSMPITARFHRYLDSQPATPLDLSTNMGRQGGDYSV